MPIRSHNQNLEVEELLKAFAKIQAGIEIFLVNQVKDRGWQSDRNAVKQTMEHLISGSDADADIKRKCNVLIALLKADEQILAMFCLAIRIKIKCMMQQGVGGEGFKITKNLKSHGIRAASLDSAVPAPDEFVQMANDFVLHVNTIDSKAAEIDEEWARQEWHNLPVGSNMSIGDLPTITGRAFSRGAPVDAGGLPASIGDMKTVAAGGLSVSIGDMKTIASLNESGFPASLTESMGGRYSILELLGEGGFGRVFKAIDNLLGRTVALKHLKASVLTERVLREARAAAKLNHPSIVHVYDVLKSEGELFIVMEFVEGSSLREVLRGRRSGLSLAETLPIMTQLCDAMECAHKSGIVHRDIKPENILCNSDLTRIKVADFGLARIEDSVSLSLTGNMSGTILYMAPEQLADAKHVDFRADIFSIGKVLYEMLTGDHPSVVETGRLPDNAQIRSLVEQCVRTDPEKRIQSVSSISDALQLIGKEQGAGKE